MITASPSIRALILRVSDIAHLHRWGPQHVGSAEPRLAAGGEHGRREATARGGDGGLTKRWRMLGMGRVKGRGGEEEEKTCSRRRNEVISLAKTKRKRGGETKRVEQA